MEGRAQAVAKFTGKRKKKIKSGYFIATPRKSWVGVFGTPFCDKGQF